jgi:hypothetical protein
VSTEATGLSVLSPQQPAFDHCRSPNAGAERNHDHIVATSRGSNVAFSQQGHACIVLDHEWQTEFFAAPRTEIDFGSIVIFPVGGDYASNPRVREPAEAERHAEASLRIDLAAFCELTHHVRKLTKDRAQLLGRVHSQLVTGQDGRTLDHGNGCVAAPQIDGKCWFLHWKLST